MQTGRNQLQTEQWRFGVFRPVLLGAMWIIAAACSPTPNEPRLDHKTLAQADFILTDTLRTEMILAPDSADRLGFSDLAAPAGNARLSDVSQAGFERSRLLRLDLLDQLGRRPVLPEDHLLARDLRTVTDAYLRLTELQSIGYGRLSPLGVAPYAIDPFSGIWIEGPDLLSRIHRVENLADAEAFVRRLDELSGAIDDTRRRLRADAETGIVPPRLLLDQLYQRLDRLLQPGAPTLEGLSADLDNLMSGVPVITDKDRQALTEAARSIVRDALRPAYLRLANDIDALRQTAPLTTGLWTLPGSGDAFRKFLDWHIGSSPFTTGALHALHLDVTADRRTALLETLDGLAPDAGDIGRPQTGTALNTLSYRLETTFTEIAPDPAGGFDPSPLTRENALPEDSVDLTGVRFEQHAADESRPARLLISSSQIAKWPDWLQALFLSADFQTPATRIATAIRGRAGTARIRLALNFPGFQLGWQSDAHVQASARLQAGPHRLAWQHWQLIEAGLAAADTGLHHAHWSADETRDYLMRETALSADLAGDAVAMIAARPGHYAARLEGARRLTTLRVRARAILGDTYREPVFQEVLLGDGPRPFDMVKDDVEAWYESQL